MYVSFSQKIELDIAKNKVQKIMNVQARTRYGQIIFPNQDTFVGRSVKNYGEYCQELSNALITFITNGDCIVEIGSGIGIFTVLISRLVGNTGKVYAYEPERINFSLLNGNIAINNLNNVYTTQAMFSDNVKNVVMPELDLSSTTNISGLSLLDVEKNTSGYSVPCYKLDSVFFNKLDLIKINVNQMELKVVNGAVETIKKLKPYLFINCLDNKNENEIVEIIKNLGYKIFYHHGFIFNPNNFYENKENIFVKEDKINYQTKNLICVPVEKELPTGHNLLNLKEFKI